MRLDVDNVKMTANILPTLKPIPPRKRLLTASYDLKPTLRQGEFCKFFVRQYRVDGSAGVFGYDWLVPLSISEVAKQIGIRPSAIRYYEQIGVLPSPHRVSGQRRYDVIALHRLVVIQKARQAGFTLTEFKQLFFGFRAGTPPSVRWQKLKKRKIVELNAKLE